MKEVLQELHQFSPEISFEPLFLESTGDRDLITSLRTLNKTDFFTKEIDQLLLQGRGKIAIHSAKDLPEPLPKGLQIVALTRGVDPTDSLVMREKDTFATLPPGALIATSSERRESVVKSMRANLRFRDLRGTIHARLELLEKGEADGVVVAEAALIRLGLTHLNRLRLPGFTTPLQGQLAIISREGDTEMQKLFAPLDTRLLPKALYLGPEMPLKAFQDRQLIHYPLIDVAYRPAYDTGIMQMLHEWPRFTHLILTSKTAVRAIVNLLRAQKLKEKIILAVGTATQELLQQQGISSLVAQNECAEGIIELIDSLSLSNPYLLWPHSSLSRKLIEEELIKREIPFLAPILYDIYPLPEASLPDLTNFDEVIFSSPSTVNAFFNLSPRMPAPLKLTPIGPITAQTLAASYSNLSNLKK